MFIIIAFVVAMLSERIEKAQEVLKESEKKHRDLVEEMADIIYTYVSSESLLDESPLNLLYFYPSYPWAVWKGKLTQ